MPTPVSTDTDSDELQHRLFVWYVSNVVIRKVIC